MCQSCKLLDMDVYQKFKCEKHGLRHVQYKCDYCCNVASFRCRANTYFCEPCHEDRARLGKRNCGGNSDRCPSGVAHHPTKKGVPLAPCILCTSAIQIRMDFYEDPVQVRLQQTLERVDGELKTIVKNKKRLERLSESARRSSSYSSRKSGSQLSQRSNSSMESISGYGRKVF